jgi:hypothetical protein
VPTGDPNMPPDLLKAKHIRELILQKSQTIYMGQTNNIDIDDDNQDLEPDSTVHEYNSASKIPKFNNLTPNSKNLNGPVVTCKQNSSLPNSQMSEFMQWFVLAEKKI